MKKISILVIIFFAFSQINAQEESQTEKKGFLIVSAGKNYKAMKKLAEKVSTQLNYKLDLREHESNENIGLTLSKEDCEKQGFEFPSYIQRGRSDDGNFVSIEYTDAYEGFTPGYYILVVSSYTKGNAELKKSLNFVKKYHKTAYIKYADIYVGCMH